MSTFVTDAVVLGYENRGESDRIYHLFTDKHGKADVLARGGQKILSKLAPHLEPPALVRVLIAKGRFGDKLAGSQIKNSYPNIRKDFARREILFFCFKIVDWTTRPEEKDERVYEFLKSFLDFLEHTPTQNRGSSPANYAATGGAPPLGGGEFSRITNIFFLLKFFSLIGFRPEMLKNKPKQEVADFIKNLENASFGDLAGGNFKIQKEFVDFIENWVAGILEKRIRLG